MSIEFLAIGRVQRPHGVRGELLLETLTDFPEHLAEVETVYLGDEAVPYALEHVRFHRRQLLIQIADCADRDRADTYRGQLVQIRVEQAAPPPPGAYYFHQVIGLSVITETGEALGTVVEIIETGANDVYVVRGETGEILLPAIKSVILTIDLETKLMTVHLLEGLR